MTSKVLFSKKLPANLNDEADKPVKHKWKESNNTRFLVKENLRFDIVESHTVFLYLDIVEPGSADDVKSTILRPISIKNQDFNNLDPLGSLRFQVIVVSITLISKA